MTYHDPETITLLLNRGANANARNEFGLTPLDLAREEDYLQGTDVLKRLEEAQRGSHV